MNFYAIKFIDVFYYHITSICFIFVVFQVGKMLIIMVTMAVYLMLGTLPMGDNFSYIGGFISGLLLGFVILIRTKSNSSRKHERYQYALCIISFMLLSVG